MMGKKVNFITSSMNSMGHLAFAWLSFERKYIIFLFVFWDKKMERYRMIPLLQNLKGFLMYRYHSSYLHFCQEWEW